MKVLNGGHMTKDKLIKLLENIPNDYEVLIDTKKLRTIFTDHENKQVNLFSDVLFQYACNYNQLLALGGLIYTNKECAKEMGWE